MRLGGWFYIGTALFLVAAACLLLALDRQRPALLWAAVLVFLAAGTAFAAAVWLRGQRPDWRRIHAEQRLWESGPLGRAWLRIRQRLSDRG
jgi:hypothetical protein